jgi:transaldolase/glucose-6-phosphate isomerase
MNPLRKIHGYGQSIWLDYISRELLDGLGLHKLIAEDGITGVTSNPAIFEKSIRNGETYAADIVQSSDVAANVMAEHLVLEDIRRAASELYPVYEATLGQDGFASLEVSPHLAHDAQSTLIEARRFWAELDQSNAMIKVPATPAGIAAIETLIAEGINVNVTLLFSVEVYRQVAEAWLRGLERRHLAGGDLSRVASVASFFVSRIDSVVDAQIDQRLASGASPGEAHALQALRGQVAIANARQAYMHYLKIVTSPRWRNLASMGAQPQRLLWASTGVKDPAYRDVRYVEELIAPETVNTVPPATLDAFREHGVPRASLLEDLDGALDTLHLAGELGINLGAITAALLDDGLRLFTEAFERLLEAIETTRQASRQALGARY